MQGMGGTELAVILDEAEAVCLEALRVAKGTANPDSAPVASFSAATCSATGEEALDLLEANKDWLFISPNIGFTAIATYEGDDWFTQEQVQAMGFREELDSAVAGIQALMKRGVRILGGGDYGFMITPHGQNARDLDHFIKHCGMSPMESILTMTKNGGEAMDMPDRLGQIREGFLADLLLVDGNPLADTKVLLRRENLRLIMKDGKLHKHLNRK